MLSTCLSHSTLQGSSMCWEPLFTTLVHVKIVHFAKPWQMLSFLVWCFLQRAGPKADNEKTFCFAEDLTYHVQGEVNACKTAFTNDQEKIKKKCTSGWLDCLPKYYGRDHTDCYKFPFFCIRGKPYGFPYATGGKRLSVDIRCWQYCNKQGSK